MKKNAPGGPTRCKAAACPHPARRPRRRGAAIKRGQAGVRACGRARRQGGIPYYIARAWERPSSRPRRVRVPLLRVTARWRVAGGWSYVLGALCGL
ncbi:MAG: hypothetical protein IJT30_09145 [Muribaculaceae bacterium]|nr:hypothetical protein [Muribaculaceae bacterium]